MRSVTDFWKRRKKRRSTIPSTDRTVQREVLVPKDSGAQVPAISRKGDVILDLYEVLDILGEGGMGTVYKVHHRGWNSDLAVKSPLPEVFTKPGGKEDFIREAETWVNLGLHPNIVQCYYVRTLGNVPRLFAEYVDGGSLSHWIRTYRLYAGEREQALERILNIAIQFAWGLHAAHKQGLVHQDVKPANVMLTVDGVVKITDFGLAKARIMAGESNVLGREQNVLVSYGGMTPAYCSPEQAAKRPMTQQTDLWSWGVSVLHMFVGSVTWQIGIAAMAALEDYVQRGAVHSSIPAMPERLVAVLRHCFQQQVNDRPASMLEVAVILQEIYQEVIGHPHPDQFLQPVLFLADHYNNRGVSLFDLGKQDEAITMWQKALKSDPSHLEATYNLGLTLWRQARHTDLELLHQLQELDVPPQKKWLVDPLLAQVYLEQGYPEAAFQLLRETTQKTLKDVNVQSLLAVAQAHYLAQQEHTHILNYRKGDTVEERFVDVSLDGQIALSLDKDRYLRIWEVVTNHCLYTMPEPVPSTHKNTMAGITEGVAISADGRFVFYSSTKGVQVWEVVIMPHPRVHRFCILPVDTRIGQVIQCSADGHLVLTYGRDGILSLWEIKHRRCLYTENYGQCFTALSGDGHLLAIGGGRYGAFLYEMPTGEDRGYLREFTSTCALDVSGNGERVLSGNLNREVLLWDTTTCEPLQGFSEHKEIVRSVSLSPDEQWAFSMNERLIWSADQGRDDQDRGRLWEVTSGRCLRTFLQRSIVQKNLPLLHSYQTNIVKQDCLYLNLTRGKMLADGNMAIFFEEGSLLIQKIRATPYSCSLQLSHILAYNEAARINMRAQKLLQQAKESLRGAHFSEALQAVHTVRNLPGHERTPASRDAWKDLSLYCLLNGLREGRLIRTFQERTPTMSQWQTYAGRVKAVCLSADGRLALSGGADTTIRIWKVESGQCLRILQGHIGPVTSVCLSVDGRIAISGSDDGTIRLWNIATGECLSVFQGHVGAVRSVSLSTDNGIILSGGNDTTVRIWEIKSGKCVGIFREHTAEVSSVSLSSDGCLALSGSFDETLKLWELERDLEARPLANWDEGILPYVTTFLTLHRGYAVSLPQGRKPSRQELQGIFIRHGKPYWTEQDFQQLILQIRQAGYGWVRPGGIQHKLDAVAASWQEPPPLYL